MNKTWRPDGWQKNPCDECARKSEDEYGLLCDLPCGRHTAYMNQEAGADAMLVALVRLASESPTKTFTIDAREYHCYVILDAVNRMWLGA